MSDSFKFTDSQALCDHFSGDEELIVDLIEFFEDSYNDTLNPLKDALASETFRDIELHAHTLKGMIANFFSSELKDYAEQLEVQGKEKKLESADALVEKLVAGIPLLIEELKAFSKTL